VASPGPSRAGELLGTSGAVVVVAFALGYVCGWGGDEAKEVKDAGADVRCVWNCASGVICFCDREAAWLYRNLSGVSCVNISKVGVYVLGCSTGLLGSEEFNTSHPRRQFTKPCKTITPSL